MIARASRLATFSMAVLSLGGCGSHDTDGDSRADGDSLTADTRASDTAAVDTEVADAGDVQADVADVTNPGWWRPGVETTWQWQLQGEVDTRYAVDLYDIDMAESSTQLIAALQADGKKVVCYFSAGSYEEFRDDAGEFAEADLGDPLDDWPGERWLDIRTENVRRIMRARLDRARDKGCDGVEPDNVDGYTNDTGIALDAADQLDFNRFLATEAHARGLAVGLKNDLNQIEALVGDFDFALDEQCHQYDECDSLAPFVAAGKPVFVAEYQDRWVSDADQRATLCAASRADHLHTLVLPVLLDGSFRYSCDD